MLNTNIIGANLVKGAKSWSTWERCPYDLIFVVDRKKCFHDNDMTDLSWIVAVFENNMENREKASEQYPFSGGYIVYSGCIHNGDIQFYLS